MLVSAGILASCGPVAGSLPRNLSESPNDRPGTSPLWDGVRISRSFFEEGTLNVRVHVASSETTAYDRSSRAVWRVGEPIGAAPGPGAIADFRDRLGCAAFADGLELCFITSPDVSTVTVNAKTTAVRGLSALASSWAVPSPSPGVPSGSCEPAIAYKTAARDDTELRIEFTIARCGVVSEVADFILQNE